MDRQIGVHSHIRVSSGHFRLVLSTAEISRPQQVASAFKLYELVWWREGFRLVVPGVVVGCHGCAWSMPGARLRMAGNRWEPIDGTRVCSESVAAAPCPVSLHLELNQTSHLCDRQWSQSPWKKFTYLGDPY